MKCLTGKCCGSNYEVGFLLRQLRVTNWYYLVSISRPSWRSHGSHHGEFSPLSFAKHRSWLMKALQPSRIFIAPLSNCQVWRNYEFISSGDALKTSISPFNYYQNTPSPSPTLCLTPLETNSLFFSNTTSSDLPLPNFLNSVRSHPIPTRH